MSHEHWVPTDILVEFLLKLPVVSLLRCKSVCKRWYSLISSQRFIKSHLTLAPSKTHYRIVSIDHHHKYMTCNLYDFEMSGASFNVLELDNPFIHKNARVSIVGSCNGLLCITVNRYDIIIWNPITRRVNSLPYINFGYQDSGHAIGFGFGYDESNDDYKVVAISGMKRVKIYSLKSGCWKKVGNFPRGNPWLAVGMFFNGAIHWTGNRVWEESSDDSLWTIVSFDLATETFGEILQPMYDEGFDYLTLCIFGEWLCVVCDYPGNRSEVWVMKVYGVQDSWTKLVSIPHITGIKIPKYLKPLCITHDDKVLLTLEKKLVLYDPKDSSFSEIQKIDYDCFSVDTFVESLVSPMPSGATN